MTPQLANATVQLQFQPDGRLVVRNLLSGSERALNWPAFAVRIGDWDISGGTCELLSCEPAGADAIRCSYAHGPSGVTVSVLYSLWERGFRKSLQVAGPDLPTPARVYVDIQPVKPEEVTVVGFEAQPPDFGQVTDQEGEETSFGTMPGCGYAVYLDDWFVGMEHAAAFTTVKKGLLEAYHHPTWRDGQLAEVPVIYGAAASPAAVRDALDAYIRSIRLPRLDQFLVSLCTFWSDPYIGNMEYDVSLDGYRAYLQAMLDLEILPDVLTLDAGWNDRRSILHFKHDPADAALLELAEEVRRLGLDLSLWISRNGPMGFDPKWAAEQGYAVGKGQASSYSGEDYLVMLDRQWEADLGDRLVELTGKIGARHFKIDWDNECASNESFDEQYPTRDHVREETLNSWFRIEDRMLAVNPEVLTRDGWWPSPWLLAHGSHLWLPASGDCEYSTLPARTQRDRALNHRDAMYHKVLVTDASPVPLDPFDNHEFAQAPRNPVQEERHIWLDNLILTFTRGTSYITLFLNPESLDEWQAAALRQVLAWARHHAPELLTDGGRMVLGNPAVGEIYGFLNPSADGAWLVLRNPSVQPQPVSLPFSEWLGYEPASVWQVYPAWQRLDKPRTLLGHEVVLLRATREAVPELSPLPGVEFMTRPCGDGVECLFPGNRPLGQGIGPCVAPLMQLPELQAEAFVETAKDGTISLQWFVTVPYRMAKPELLITLHGPQEVLDGLSISCSTSRYQGGSGEHFIPAERIHRKLTHGYGTRRFMPPVGERTRDDYVFRLPSGGRVSVTAEISGEGVEQLVREAWLSGWEAPARQTIERPEPPVPGPQLPPHPYGFPRSVRLL